MSKEVTFEITGTLSGENGQDSKFNTFVVNGTNLMDLIENEAEKKIDAIQKDVNTFKKLVNTAANGEAVSPAEVDNASASVTNNGNNDADDGMEKRNAAVDDSKKSNNGTSKIRNLALARKVATQFTNSVVADDKSGNNDESSDVSSVIDTNGTGTPVDDTPVDGKSANGGGLFRSPTANLKMALNNSFAKTIYKPNDFAKNMITNTVSTTLKNANPYGKKQHTKRAPSIFRQFSYKPKSRKSRKASYRSNKKSRSRK